MKVILILLAIQICYGSGYTIPAGWAVMVCPPAVHLNPAKYENPVAFNPWRWEVSSISENGQF